MPMNPRLLRPTQGGFSSPGPVTLYFNGAVDGDWAEVGNWWLDSGHTVAAPSLPAAGDSVIATAIIGSNSGGAVTAENLIFDGGGGLLITITVTGSATFNDNSANFGTVAGNATFNDDAINTFVSTVTGNATFNDNSANNGTVTGNATFSDNSANFGTVTGTATFTGSACNEGGTAGTFVPDPPPLC